VDGGRWRNELLVCTWRILPVPYVGTILIFSQSRILIAPLAISLYRRITMMNLYRGITVVNFYRGITVVNFFKA
jgi:hypothetical protein